MNAKDVKQLLERYRQLLKRQIKSLESSKERVIRNGATEAIGLAESFLTIAALEVTNIDQAVEWLNNIQD